MPIRKVKHLSLQDRRDLLDRLDLEVDLEGMVWPEKQVLPDLEGQLATEDHQESQGQMEPSDWMEKADLPDPLDQQVQMAHLEK